MRNKMKKQLLVAAGLLALAATLAGPAAAEQRCPPNCGVDIELPANPAEPPSIPASQQVIVTVRGAVMQVTVTGGQPGKMATKLVFRKAGPGEEGEPHTPFVSNPGPNGKPITEVRLNPAGRTTVFIRQDDAHTCFGPPGCKYDIVNDGDPERPALDPHIIIDP